MKFGANIGQNDKCGNFVPDIYGLIFVQAGYDMKKTLSLSILLLLLCGSASFAQAPKRYTAKVEETFRHDTGSYTQGLFFYKGGFYESAGQYGESTMRKVDLRSGKVLKRHDFERRYFAEGSCIAEGRLYVLSWRERTCFVLNPDTFERIGTFRYNTEGWGLTTDGKSLIMSDGSNRIQFRDPKSFLVTREIKVTINGRPLDYLNELEWIDGRIWANVYGSDVIVMIDPESGVVTGIVDCSNIYPEKMRRPADDVLNGIAYNPADGKIYVTGKYWPKMYRITLR